MNEGQENRRIDELEKDIQKLLSRTRTLENIVCELRGNLHCELTKLARDVNDLRSDNTPPRRRQLPPDQAGGLPGTD